MNGDLNKTSGFSFSFSHGLHPWVIRPGTVGQLRQLLAKLQPVPLGCLLALSLSDYKKARVEFILFLILL